MTLSESQFYPPAKSEDQDSAHWRQEIARRVRAHHARRRRRIDPNASLDLQFDPPESDRASPGGDRLSATNLPEEQRAEAEGNAACATRAFEEHGSAAWGRITEDELPQEVLRSSGPARESIDLTEAPIVPELREPLPPFPRVKPRTRERKIIEFPRLNEASIASRDELAEPIADQLRIFEAVEELPAPEPGPLASIRLDSCEPDPEPIESRFDLPLPVAGFERRGLALAVDTAVFGIVYAIFVATAMHLGRSISLNKPMLLAGIGACLLLFITYEFIFLFYSTGTPGMRAAGLMITDFTGCPPPRHQRALRAMALVLSCAALGLGLVWAFIDEDRLCWHDRITHTYLRQQE